MAEERIQLTLGGDYTAGAAFAQGNRDIKNFQKAANDMTGAIRGGLGTITKSLDSDLSNSIQKASGILGNLAHGGVWGVLAAGVTAAIGYAVEKFKEAQEAAKKYSEILRTEVVDAIKSIGSKFKDTSDQITKAREDAKGMMDVLNGEVANKAQMKIHELHIETLQKMTDDMSKAGKDVIVADEAYQAALIKGSATMEQAANAVQTAKDNSQAATDKRIAAEEAYANITKEREQIEALMADNGRGWLAQRQTLEEGMKKNEELYASGVYDQYTYIQNRKKLSVQLSKIEEEHKDQVAQLNAVKKSETEASKAVEEAKRKEQEAQRNITLATQKEEAARLQVAQSELDAEQKLKSAVDALANEGKAATEKRVQAEEALANATQAREKVESEMYNYGKGWLAEKQTLEGELAKVEQLYKDGLISHTEAVKNQKEIKVKIAELEASHKSELEQLNEAVAKETEATTALDEARQKEADALKAVTDANISSANVQEQVKDKIAAAGEAQRAAVVAQEKANKAVAEKEYMDKQAAHIQAICAKQQVEASEYVELFRKMMEDGAKETDAYAALQKKLNDAVKKRADSEGKIAKEEEEKAKGEKKDEKLSASAYVKVDSNSLGSGIDKWDKKNTAWHKARQQQSKDVKEQAQLQKKFKAEMLPFIQLLKGNMPKTQAEYYIKQLAKDYSKEDLEKMYQMAMKKQFAATKSERAKRQRVIEEINKALQKQGLK